MKVTLVYYDYDFEAPQLSTLLLLLNLNSTFLPRQARYVRNAQPAGRDQWVTMYSRYIVHRARVMARVAQTTAASDVFVGHGVFGNANPAADIAGLPEGSIVPYQPELVTLYADPIRLDTGWIDLATLAGRSQAEYRSNDDSYGAAVGASPTAVLRHGLSLTEIHNVAGVNVDVAVVMYQEVEFFDRLLAPES